MQGNDLELESLTGWLNKEQALAYSERLTLELRQPQTLMNAYFLLTAAERPESALFTYEHGRKLAKHQAFRQALVAAKHTFTVFTNKETISLRSTEVAAQALRDKIGVVLSIVREGAKAITTGSLTIAMI